MKLEPRLITRNVFRTPGIKSPNTDGLVGGGPTAWPPGILDLTPCDFVCGMYTGCRLCMEHITLLKHHNR